MKTKLILLGVLSVSMGMVNAQRPDFSPQCKQQMQKLSYLAGDWKGEAVVTQGGQHKVAQTEHIEWKLDGLVLAIEGIGKEGNEITFHALAFINFDPADQQFKFKSYLKEGYSTDAYFKVVSDNKFEWGFDIPAGGKSKYEITLDPSKGTWNEVGQYSRDGNTWMKFIELNLVKQ